MNAKFKAAEGLNNRSLTYSVSTFPLGCSLLLCRFPTALLRKLGIFQCLKFYKDCEGMNTFRAAPMTLKLKPWWIWERRLWGLLRLEPWSSPLPRLRPRRWANGLINLRAMARNHALAFHEKEMRHKMVSDHHLHEDWLLGHAIFPGLPISNGLSKQSVGPAGHRVRHKCREETEHRHPAYIKAITVK